MPRASHRSEQASAFFAAVYAAVSEVPYGKVTSGPSGATRQAAALRAEGVEVQRSAMGEYSVDFGVYGWFPDMLPSEEAELAEESDEET
ncbi:hypothetical protein EG327_003918 [Venturia inaequalis]|uniref:Uncharacterized protein n=1 Tax=Venturia inaequalis TaxID=5025 RepID=A0A8H3ZC67_VENIN|nr:hypothetical protein EG327_003918 [Venturia inaequalis]